MPKMIFDRDMLGNTILRVVPAKKQSGKKIIVEYAVTRASVQQRLLEQELARRGGYHAN